MLKKMDKIYAIKERYCEKELLWINYNRDKCYKGKMHGAMRITNHKSRINPSDREIFPEEMTFKLKSNE